MKPPSLREQTAARLYAEGHPTAEIMRTCGLSGGRLARVVDRLGLRRRRRRVVQPPPGGPPYPTSGDPNIIGEHEVPPVCCPYCLAALPWALIKGWR